MSNVSCRADTTGTCLHSIRDHANHAACGWLGPRGRGRGGLADIAGLESHQAFCGKGYQGHVAQACIGT